jgi:class 3 adenylate cyclase
VTEADRPRPPPELRIADADRDRTIDLLRQHCSDGRLTLDEFSERVEVVLAARTGSDLEAVMADLPGAQVPVAEADRRRSTSWTVAVMGSSSRKGRWRPARRTRVVSFMGGCELDLRRAEIDGPEVVITAVAFMGGIDIVVPEGIEVDLSGIPIMGGKDLRLADVPPIPGAPRIRVRAVPVMGGVTVRSKATRARGPDAALAAPSEEHAALRRGERELRRSERASRSSGRHRDRRPGGAMPTAPDGTVTILFSDIVGFSALTERVGDLEATRLVSDHNRLVRDQVAAHGGYEVKSQGDGFMVAFGGAGRALRCAVDLQRAFERYSLENPGEPIRLRVGLHTGEVVQDGDDFHGRTVIMASRLADAASPSEILVSSLVHELTNSSGEFSFGDDRPVELKGISGPQRAYPLVWSAGS